MNSSSLALELLKNIETYFSFFMEKKKKKGLEYLNCDLLRSNLYMSEPADALRPLLIEECCRSFGSSAHVRYKVKGPIWKKGSASVGVVPPQG